MDLSHKVKENYTKFRNHMVDYFSSKVDVDVYKTEVAKKANQKEHELLTKRVEDLTDEMNKDVKALLIGKIQELQTLVDTKANQVEVDIINHDKGERSNI